jgi:hypothetical protein
MPSIVLLLIGTRKGYPRRKDVKSTLMVSAAPSAAVTD